MAVRNKKLDVENIEFVEPKHPNSFKDLLYMNYSKLDILKMYVVLYNNHFKLKAMYEETELKNRLYEKKLEDNNVPVIFDDEETQEYITGAKALIKSNSKTFKEEFEKELGTYDEEINYQISVKLEKARESFKNTVGFSLIQVNRQIDMLQDLLDRTYSNKSMNLQIKNKQVLNITAELRQQYAAKEKLLGRDVQKTAHVNMNKIIGNKQEGSSEAIDWNEMKNGVISQPKRIEMAVIE